MTFSFDPAVETAMVNHIALSADISTSKARDVLAAIRLFYADKLPSGDIALFYFGVGAQVTYDPPLQPWKP